MQLGAAGRAGSPSGKILPEPRLASGSLRWREGDAGAVPHPTMQGDELELSLPLGPLGLSVIFTGRSSPLPTPCTLGALYNG